MRARLIGGSLVGLSIVYLALFVPRGWIPHDEGMTGQSAERVLRGEVPHVNYEEPYTGGLAKMHALLFRLVGVDLIYPRWLLFAGAVLAQVLVYLILSRYLPPINAAIGAWVALGWSFPNYFAALPSWWLLVCALVCLWAFLRHVETGLLRYAALAGLAAGVSILIKQTGLYILVAVVVTLLYGGGSDQEESTAWWPGRIVCAGAALASLGLAFVIISGHLALSDLVYLGLPILGCTCLLILDDASRPGRQSWASLAAPAAAVAAAALPLAYFVAPYVINHQLEAFVNGVFVLPQRRLQLAALEMPPTQWILAGVPLLAAVMPLSASVRSPALDRHGTWMMSLTGALLVVSASLGSVTSYQMIWQAARGFAALIPVAVCGLIISGRVRKATDRRVLFACAAFLAWASLVQLPFSAPIYFCYVTPLAVIAAVAVAGHNAALSRTSVSVSAAVFLAFALVSMNRGHVNNLGLTHAEFAIDTPLALEKASLRVTRADAVLYRRVVDLIEQHIADGQLVAGPDAPEVYFLSGRFSPTGTIFDFFSDDISPVGELNDMPGLSAANVVVLNHGHQFAAGPSAQLAVKVRRSFPNSERVGALEVRWR
ncbi:MAG TPA: glycosyltransferase family 39 protein [Vicinamibacterales bacterium]|nr:glycosyltransferase family 39 protein [Vicinamibacterales bacterium]